MMPGMVGLALATELGMRPVVAHYHLGLGKLYRRTGKQQQAQEHLAAATAMYREIGMTYWLISAEANSRNTECAQKYHAVCAPHANFTQELPRKLLSTRAKEPQRREREKR
jgi:hypothetical protein